MTPTEQRIFFTANLAGQIRTWADTWENRIPQLLELATPAEKSQAQTIQGYELSSTTLQAIAAAAQERLKRDRNDKMAQLIAGELSALLG